MADRAGALDNFDRNVVELELARDIVEIERCFRNTVQSAPFRGAIFSWWSFPPRAREPDVVFSSGDVSGVAEHPLFASGDPWAVSLPVISFDHSEDESPDVQVAVAGPGRRLAILKAALSLGSAQLRANDYDWRGRFLLLAHLLAQGIGALRADERPNLGRREVQCLKLAAEGLKAKQIASALGIGQQTVQFHLSRAREKLDCSNTVQAVARAAQFGLLPDISPDPDKRA